jgi:hypothetical protein
MKVQEKMWFDYHEGCFQLHLDASLALGQVVVSASTVFQVAPLDDKQPLTIMKFNVRCIYMSVWTDFLCRRREARARWSR